LTDEQRRAARSNDAIGTAFDALARADTMHRKWPDQM
jgi:hypothetical protein